MGAMNRLNVARMLGGKSGMAREMGGPAAGINFKYFLDRRAVLNLVDRKKRRGLARQGGYVRQIARRSIRVKPYGKTSLPGNPPFTHTRFLRDDIFFAYDPSSQSVVIGPHKAPWLNKLLEHGGRQTMQVWRNRETGKTHLYRKRPLSPRRYVHLREKHIKYAARPFMGPAEVKARPKLAEIWAKSVA